MAYLFVGWVLVSFVACLALCKAASRPLPAPGYQSMCRESVKAQPASHYANSAKDLAPGGSLTVAVNHP